jgi:hypothetical protein
VLESMSRVVIIPGQEGRDVAHPLQFFDVHWRYIARLRRTCKRLSMIFYSEAESRIWERAGFEGDYPPVRKWFIYEALKKMVKFDDNSWCYMYNRPEWERMRHAVPASMIWAKVHLRMHGLKPFMESHIFRISGDGFRLERRQVAFSCPQDRWNHRDKMDLWRRENTEETHVNTGEPGSKLLLVNHMSFTSAGSLEVWLHDSVTMSRGRRCGNGNPVISVGEQFSAVVWIEKQMLAFDFMLTMEARRL